MKIGIGLVILVCIMTIIGLEPLYCETIYTIGGKAIQAKITEKTENTIWYEAATGAIIEEAGIDIAEVEKVLNDDGSISKYSPGHELPLIKGDANYR